MLLRDVILHNVNWLCWAEHSLCLVMFVCYCCRTAHFMKVKAAIEKEYWLLMLSQPRPAPKPISEPPLSRLSHFVYNASSMGNGHQGPPGAADGGEHGVVPRSLSDSGGLGTSWH